MEGGGGGGRWRCRGRWRWRWRCSTCSWEMSLAACSFLTGWTLGGGEGEEGTARIDTPAPTSLGTPGHSTRSRHSVPALTLSPSTVITELGAPLPRRGQPPPAECRSAGAERPGSRVPGGLGSTLATVKSSLPGADHPRGGGAHRPHHLASMLQSSPARPRPTCGLCPAGGLAPPGLLPVITLAGRREGGGAGALSLLRGWERGAEWQRRQLQEPREAVASLM